MTQRKMVDFILLKQSSPMAFTTVFLTLKAMGLLEEIESEDKIDMIELQGTDLEQAMLLLDLDD